MSGPDASQNATALAEWRWCPPAAPDPAPVTARTARGRLEAALRAGHSLGATFEVGLEAERAPPVTLSCFDGNTARWITRVLVPGYGRASWVRQPLRTRSPAPDIEWGRRVRAWPERFRETADGPSAMGQLVLALTGVPTGVAVRWRFAPYPPTWGRASGAEHRDSDALRPPGPAWARHPPLSRPDARPVPLPYPVFWKAQVRLEFPFRMVADAPELRRSVRRVVEGALRSGEANGVRFSPRGLLPSIRPRTFPLTEEELVGVLPHLDGDVRTSPGNPPVPGTVLPVGRAADGRLVGPLVEADQGRHVAVLGETGMGKSATLVAVARKASCLGGVVLLDPLGETARAFVRGLSTPAEKERLTWVSPRASECGINALEGIGRRDTDPVLADRRLNDLVHALRRVRSERYDSKYWGPRLEEMLTRALAAAAAFDSGTLEDAHTLLATGGRTRRVVPPEAQDAVRELADRVRDRPEDAEGARRLLYEVVRSPVLRRMLCTTPPELHAATFVSPGRIAVISGDASVVGESVARYLLSVYLALIWSELLARPSAPKTFVVLDETQWFSHESLAEMLRLARRRNVHVVLATQTIASLPEGVDEAVWTNVSDFVAFRGSPEEAREIARATRGVSVEELLALPRGHAAVLLGKGNSVEWVRTAGRPTGTELPADDDEGAAHSGPPDDPFPGGLDGRSHGSVDDVLEWIRTRSREAPRSGTIDVELAELRRHVDPSGAAVRAAGALLGRTGALVSSVKGPSGSVWQVAIDRIPTARTDHQKSARTHSEVPARRAG